MNAGEKYGRASELQLQPKSARQVLDNVPDAPPVQQFSSGFLRIQAISGLSPFP
jgi:hypothetical protein